MQIFIYTGPTIMRVPRVYKDLNASLPVISLYNFVQSARSTQKEEKANKYIRVDKVVSSLTRNILIEIPT
jgi:hypothetical protein